MDEPKYRAVWPLGAQTNKQQILQKRLNSLNHRTVGFVWSHGFRGDEMFDLIKVGLRAQYPDVRFVDHPTYGNIHGPNEKEVVARLPHRLTESGVDAVVVGVAA